jgi:hypothetical protein
MLEKIYTGKSVTPFLKNGDRITISVMRDGVDLFGTINQRVQQV